MQDRMVPRMRPLSAVTVVLVLIVTSFVSVPFAMGGDNVQPLTTGSRALYDNDLAAFSVVTPHDRDENVAGSLVANNAIPVGSTTVQANVKNVGNLAWGNAIPVDFYFETGTSSVKWNDSMDKGANGWTSKDNTASRVHWHITNANKHGGSNSLVSNYIAGPSAGLYGNNWEETAEMKNCVNIPVSPSTEPYVQFWNSTNTQSQADGGYVQMQIGAGPWVDITPYNPLPPPTLSYRGTINSGTSILSNGKGAFTGSNGWFPTEKFFLWQQQKGSVNGTCVKFRLWFSSDGSNSQNYHGWFVDDFVVFNGNANGFTDDFEGGAGNWVFTNQLAVGNQEVFHQVPGSGLNGTTAWWVGNTTAGTYINGTDAVLDSPNIALTGGGFNEARYTYWQKYNISDLDGGWLELSQDGGATYNQIQPLFHLNKTNDATNYPVFLDANSDYGKIGAFSGSTGWHKMAFDLTPYIGKTIKIRYHFFSNWDNNLGGSWFIDNAVVTTWNFQPKGQQSASIVNGLNTGQKAIAQVIYTFATQSDYRIRVVVDKTGDQDITNNEIHTVVLVQNITDFSIIAPGSATVKTVNHGSVIKYWFNVTNIGNLPDDYNLTISGLPAKWSVQISPPNITGLRPVDPPFMVQVTIKTNVTDGPSSYTNNNKQMMNYSMTVKVKSGRLPALQKTLGLTAKITNTRPTVYFLLQNEQGNVYQNLAITQPFYNDPDKDPLTFIWDWGDGSAVQNTTTWPVYHIYSKSNLTAKPYIVHLKATDGLAMVDAAYPLNVSVINKAPIAKFIIVTPPVVNSYAAGDPIIFNGTAPKYSQDENPKGLSYTWDYGDGNTDNTPVANHTYSKTNGGNRKVMLTVTDEEGRSNQTTQTIMINTPPKAVITTPHDGEHFTLGEDIMFNGSLTTDNEQRLIDLDFNWTTNQPNTHMIGNQPVFKMSFTSEKSDLGVHLITLTVNDRRAKGYNSTTITIVIVKKPWHPCSLIPIPNQPAVTPAGGYISTSSFTYSVIYKSQDNIRPQYVNLMIDSNPIPFTMAQTFPSEKDFTIGVQYSVKVPGTTIGADSVHTFHFEAQDIQNTSFVAKTTDFQGPRVIKKMNAQNLAATSGLPDRTISVEIFCICKQSPVTFHLFNQSISAPSENGKTLIPIGLNATITWTIAKDMWDYVNLTFNYDLDVFKAARNKVNMSTVGLYQLQNGAWVKINAENDDVNGVLTTAPINSSTVSSASVTYGLFASLKEIVKPKPKPINSNLMQYIAIALVVIIIIVIVVVIIFLTRRKKAPQKQWGGKDGIDLKIDVLSGKGTEEGAVKPATKEEGAEGAAAVPMETTSGESVAIYRPAAAPTQPEGEEDTGAEGVAMYKPGGAAAPQTEEEEEPAPTPEAPTNEQVWTPPPTTEGEGGTETPEVPAPEQPKKDTKKDKDDDLLNEILGEEQK